VCVPGKAAVEMKSKVFDVHTYGVTILFGIIFVNVLQFGEIYCRRVSA
jgi:hypothetical protein